MDITHQLQHALQTAVVSSYQQLALLQQQGRHSHQDSHQEREQQCVSDVPILLWETKSKPIRTYILSVHMNKVRIVHSIHDYIVLYLTMMGLDIKLL